MRADEPAYPRHESYPDKELYFHGLTIREAFVMAAPHEELGMPETIDGCAAIIGISPEEYAKDCGSNWLRACAVRRIQWADATLAALEKADGQT